ncbi:hypothetical protein [Actinomadura geliboluensis]|nr:hypothetical protein [Actinomadura geliboluensis]
MIHVDSLSARRFRNESAGGGIGEPKIALDADSLAHNGTQNTAPI